MAKRRNISPSDRARMIELQSIGCIPCLMDGRRQVPPDTHHHTDARGRLGHKISTAECPWHHRGLSNGFNDAAQAKRFMGPSRAKDPIEFEQRYGTDEQLLARQERELEALRSRTIGGRPKGHALPRIA